MRVDIERRNSKVHVHMIMVSESLQHPRREVHRNYLVSVVVVVRKREEEAKIQTSTYEQNWKEKKK